MTFFGIFSPGGYLLDWSCLYRSYNSALVASQRRGLHPVEFCILEVEVNSLKEGYLV